MSVLADDIIFYGAANMQETDAGGQGGAIAPTKRVVFADIAPTGNVQVVSSAAGDTTQNVTVTGRDAAGVIISEAKTLNGLAAVVMTVNTTWERLLKAVKSLTTAGDVAVEAVTAERTGTAQSGAAKTANLMAYIQLDAGASAVDDTFNGMVGRITAGTGIGQIRRIQDYTGADKRAYVAGDWTTPPDGTSVFRISEGLVFEKSPTEVMEVRRPFYDVSAEAAGGAAREYYEKIFARNAHGTLALTNAQVSELADPSGKVTFGLAGTLDDTATATDRRTAPGGITFDNAAKNVANSQNHSAAAAQGIWLNLSLAAGDAAQKTTYELRESGSST